MKIIFRILSSPFILILIILAALRYVVIEFFMFMKYGGELSRYSKDVNPKTFAEIIYKLNNDKQ
jgi:hypothetical protein